MITESLKICFKTYFRVDFLQTEETYKNDDQTNIEHNIWEMLIFLEEYVLPEGKAEFCLHFELCDVYTRSKGFAKL